MIVCAGCWIVIAIGGIVMANELVGFGVIVVFVVVAETACDLKAFGSTVVAFLEAIPCVDDDRFSIAGFATLTI